MRLISKKLALLNFELTHWCQGCGGLHAIYVNQPATSAGHSWRWDRNVESPTISPSVNFVGRCHYFLQAGTLTFCGDSRHELAGKTIALPDLPEQYLVGRAITELGSDEAIVPDAAP